MLSYYFAIARAFQFWEYCYCLADFKYSYFYFVFLSVHILLNLWNLRMLFLDRTDHYNVKKGIAHYSPEKLRVYKARFVDYRKDGQKQDKGYVSSYTKKQNGTENSMALGMKLAILKKALEAFFLLLKKCDRGFEIRKAKGLRH